MKMSDSEILERWPKQEVPFWESMTRFGDTVSGRVFRVWRRESKRPEGGDEDVYAVLSRLSPDVCDRECIETISELPRITAIEITNHRGNGFVEYLEW